MSLKKGRRQEVLEKNFLWRQNALRATKFIYGDSFSIAASLTCPLITISSKIQVKRYQGCIFWLRHPLMLEFSPSAEKFSATSGQLDRRAQGN